MTLTGTSTRLSTRLGLAAAAAAAVVVPLAGAAPAHASATGIYRNCTALHTRWQHGVGRAGAHDHTTSGDPVTNFFHSTRAYKRAMNHNKGLDRDKDGIACEAH